MTPVSGVLVVHQSLQCWSWCSLTCLRLFVPVCCMEDEARLTKCLDFLHFASSVYFLMLTVLLSIHVFLCFFNSVHVLVVIIFLWLHDTSQDMPPIPSKLLCMPQWVTPISCLFHQFGTCAHSIYAKKEGFYWPLCAFTKKIRNGDIDIIGSVIYTIINN